MRVLGAAAFGADNIVTHEQTRALIAERGMADWASERERMPRRGRSRTAAALENLDVAGATMRFLVPRTPAQRRHRHDILSRAATDPAART